MGAAYNKKIKVSTDGTTWLDLPMTSCSLEISGDVIDFTHQENITSAAYRSRILGVHDWRVPVESKFIAGNTGLSAVRSAKLNRTTLHVQYLPDGTVANGFEGEVVVEGYNQSGEITGEETVSFTFLGNGALSDAD